MRLPSAGDWTLKLLAFVLALLLYYTLKTDKAPDFTKHDTKTQHP